MKQLRARLFSKVKQHPIVTTLITLYVLYLVSAGLIMPYVLKTKLPQWMAPFPELQASVKDVRFNPFLLRLTIEGIQIDELKEQQAIKLAGLGQVSVNLQLSSVIHQALVLSELNITDPYSRITKNAQQHFIWDAWIAASAAESNEDQPANEANETQPFPVLIESLSINKAVVDFEDFSRATPFRKHIGPMDLALNHLSTLPNDEGNYQLSIALPQDQRTAEFKWQGRIGLHPFFSEGTLELNQLAVRTLWEYIQDDVFYEPLDGYLAVGFDYQLLTKEQVDLVLNNGWVKLSDLSIAGKGETDAVLKLASQQVQGLFFDLQEKQVQIDQTKTSGLTVSAERLSDGQIKLAKLFAQRPVQEKVKTKVKEETDNAQDWQVSVTDILLEQAAVTFEDHTTSPSAQLTLDQIAGHIQNLTLTEAPANFSLSLSSHRPSKPDYQSHLKLEGAFVIPEKAVDVQLDLKDFPVAMIQPYLTPITSLSINSLLFDINGKASFKREQLNFEGSTQFRDLQLTNQAQSQAVLAGQGIYFEDINFSQSQKSLSIGEILLDEMLYPISVLKRNESGTTTNFSQLMKTTEASETGDTPDSKASDTESNKTDSDTTAPKTADEDWLVNIGKVSIKNNKLQFSDRGLDEPVYFNIEQLNGVIDQLSSKNLSRADINLAGQINGYAPFMVKGQINPLSEQAYTNVDVSMTDIALSTFSPYSRHFLNYPLVQGKFSTDLKYKLNQSELVADNQLFIDQLQLGDYVESEAGLGLPLPLAVSLLQTNSGEIDINLPIQGNLNDPDFKYGQVVVSALVNIITKAITSPFQLIANLAGSDADLSALEFQTGTSELTADSQQKITQLVTALKQRQALKLSVMGQTDIADVTTLKSQSWRRYVDSQGITIDPQNPKYLALLAQQSGQPQPTGLKQVYDLEQVVIKQQTLAPELLASLAQERALKTRKLLIDAGLTEKRIFMKASALNQPSDSSPPNAVGIKLEIK
ncbi:DUF748 domain-containing protein [Litoribrevibacter albus]|nr:DUF748 domain-containing protein [Litoribrevibacter albus]